MTEIQADEKAFFQTHGAQTALQSLDRIRQKEIIGMIVARPGFGKSRTVKYWKHKNPGVRYVSIEADVLTSCRPILNALVKALGLAGMPHNLWDMKDAVADALAKDPLLVIINEADLMTVRTFEILRSIWDRVSDLRDTDGRRGFPLALLGDIKLRDMIGRRDLERLRRRVFHKAELPPLTRNETEMILATKWKGLKYDDAGFEAILQMSHGSFGWLNNIVEIASDIAAKDGKVLTARIMHSAARELGGILEE
jgi:type II secretory pathway predicted ATPase ExeA